MHAYCIAQQSALVASHDYRETLQLQHVTSDCDTLAVTSCNLVKIFVKKREAAMRQLMNCLLSYGDLRVCLFIVHTQILESINMNTNTQ